MYLCADLRTFDLNELDSKFDVILIEPPLEEYHRMNGAVFDQYWSWDEVSLFSLLLLLLLPILSIFYLILILHVFILYLHTVC